VQSLTRQNVSIPVLVTMGIVLVLRNAATQTVLASCVTCEFKCVISFLLLYQRCIMSQRFRLKANSLTGGESDLTHAAVVNSRRTQWPFPYTTTLI